MPRASSSSAREAALRPRVAGFGDLLVESPICPLIVAWQTRLPAELISVSGLPPPCPRCGGPRGHWPPGHIHRDCGRSPASMALRGLSYSPFLLRKQPAGGLLYQTEVQLLVPVAAPPAHRHRGHCWRLGTEPGRGWGKGMKSVEPGFINPFEFGCGAWMGRSWHNSDRTLEEWRAGTLFLAW